MLESPRGVPTTSSSSTAYRKQHSKEEVRCRPPDRDGDKNAMQNGVKETNQIPRWIISKRRVNKNDGITNSNQFCER